MDSEKSMTITAGKDARFNMRMRSSDESLLIYWAEKHGVDKSEFLMASMHHYIKWINQDYDLPTAEIHRMNQMIDAMNNLATSQISCEQTVVKGMASMLGMIRGDNYLVEEDDGIL